MKNKLHLKAFTLSELLVVLVIIGILILIAIPVVGPLISKANSVEAKKQLAHIHSLQKTYFYEFSRFTDDLTQLGFEQAKTVEEGGNAKYMIEVVEYSTNSFLARATAIVDFDQDGEINVWEINQDGQLTEVVKD
ncbi:MAG: type IV pilin-like G/H family protein [bacterium]|nr:type IV pilin-like G/H family protein [bacterium]